MWNIFSSVERWGLLFLSFFGSYIYVFNLSHTASKVWFIPFRLKSDFSFTVTIWFFITDRDLESLSQCRRVYRVNASISVLSCWLFNRSVGMNLKPSESNFVLELSKMQYFRIYVNYISDTSLKQIAFNWGTLFLYQFAFKINAYSSFNVSCFPVSVNI